MGASITHRMNANRGTKPEWLRLARLKRAAVTATSTGAQLDGNEDGLAGGDYVSPTDTAGSASGHHFGLYRIYRDGDGDGDVDFDDRTTFLTTFNADSSSPYYLEYYDAENNLVVDLIDLTEFRARYGTDVFP